MIQKRCPSIGHLFQSKHNTHIWRTDMDDGPRTAHMQTWKARLQQSGFKSTNTQLLSPKLDAPHVFGYIARPFLPLKLFKAMEEVPIIQIHARDATSSNIAKSWHLSPLQAWQHLCVRLRALHHRQTAFVTTSIKRLQRKKEEIRLTNLATLISSFPKHRHFRNWKVHASDRSLLFQCLISRAAH